MKFTPIKGSFSGAITTAIILTAATIGFAQVPTDNSVDEVIALPSEKFTALKVEKPKTFTTLNKFSPETTSIENAGDVVTAPVTKPSQTTSGKKWEFGAALYLWLPALSGDIGANGRTAEIDLSMGDVLSHFKAGFMGTFEARRGRFVILNDLVWSKLTEENDTPGPLYNTSKFSVNMTIFNPQVGFRVAESEKGSFDILGGLRVTSVKNILSTTTGVLPGFSVEERKTWAAPTIGGHGIINVSEKAYLSTIFDIGGGFGTHLTGQFYGGMGYRIKPKAALVFGYRYLKNDYDDDAGFIYNTNMHGLVFGTVFRF